MENVVLNLTPRYRDVTNYRTTLGHKTNHKGQASRHSNHRFTSVNGFRKTMSFMFLVLCTTNDLHKLDR